jgi:hypothetical protein
MAKIKDYYFDEIMDMDNFNDLFEDEQVAMYQPILLDSKAAKAAAKAAAKDLKEEFIDDKDESSIECDIWE